MQTKPWKKNYLDPITVFFQKSLIKLSVYNITIVCSNMKRNTTHPWKSRVTPAILSCPHFSIIPGLHISTTNVRAMFSLIEAFIFRLSLCINTPLLNCPSIVATITNPPGKIENNCTIFSWRNYLQLGQHSHQQIIQGSLHIVLLKFVVHLEIHYNVNCGSLRIT